ncbi:MAG: YceI family protein [Candidatus Acidiferrales bacterium]
MILGSRVCRHRGIRGALLLFVVAATLSVAPRAGARESVFTLNPAQTSVEFTLGASFHTVHGTFKLKSGVIHFDTASGKASGAIVVDAVSGESGNDGRDKKMHQEILESPKFMEIVFVPTRIVGTIAPQGTSQVAVSGLLKLHGQDHEMSLNFAVLPGALGPTQATTRFSVPYVKWGLKNPSTFILRVSDTVDIDIRASGRLTPGSTSPLIPGDSRR